jgi:uncharacterized radical SAM superfamily Fe-S cluster-containing enzyme
MPERPYTYYDFTLSLCPQCLKRVDAKIILQDNKVYMLKRCLEHGPQKVLIATDAEYYVRARQYIKPSEMPLKFNTETHYGCPYDCGLCPDHEQHSCLTLLEITDRCNLSCPTCYASSSPSNGRHRTLDEIDFMLKALVENEGVPDVVQISGGEPTLHPKFFEIIEKCRAQPIRHLMVNTNGLRIANEPDFVARLSEYKEDFEVYLQFDSFKEQALTHLRGLDLRSIRLKALEHLNHHNISTTLVVTLQKGVNDDELGAIIDFALQQPCVRGVTFQPTQFAGRLDKVDPKRHRYTLTEVRQAILDQSSLFEPSDIIPVPCNPDALAMGYALKWQGIVQPLTRFINPDELLRKGRNTIVYEQDDAIAKHLIELFSTGNSVETASGELKSLLCCLPQIAAPNLKYENVFRIIIMQFIDAYNFDVRAIKKSCVHIVTPEGKLIPFETMNLFYRDAQKRQRLQELREKMI